MVKVTPTFVVMAFVSVVIGASLVTPLADIVFGGLHNATGDGISNVTGASGALYALLVLFFVILVLMIIIKRMRDK